MVLAPHHKQRPTAHHKKRSGKHQKQTPEYLKTYWPYLPLLFLGALLNLLLDFMLKGSAVTTLANLDTISRVELWTGGNSSIAIAVALIAGISAIVVITTHARAWQKAVVKGEDFIIHHPKVDILLVAVAVAGFILTRSVIA